MCKKRRKNGRRSSQLKFFGMFRSGFTRLTSSLKSNFGATMFATGFFTSLIIAQSLIAINMQWSQKENERIESSYIEQLRQEKEVVSHVMEVVGRCRHSSTTLIDLTGQNFTPIKYPGIESQRTEIKTKFNACVEEVANHESFNFAMNTTFHKKPAVINSWHGVYDSLVQYMQCANQWYVNHSTPTDIAGVCAAEKEKLKTQIDQLTKSFNATR